MKKILILLLGAFMISSIQALTYSVKVPAGTHECYIAGDMNHWNHQSMNKIDETHYTIDFPDATTTQKYKYCSGPGWGYVEKNAKGEEIDNRKYSPSDVVESWAAVYDRNQRNEKLVFNVTVPPGTNCCYIKGGWDGWSTFREMKKVDDTHFMIKLLTDKNMKYLYFGGPGNGYVEMKEEYKMREERNYSPEDVVNSFQAVYDKSVPDSMLTYSVAVPAGTQKCYIGGGWDGWMKLHEMKKTDDTHFTITFQSNKALKYMYFSGPDMKYIETNPEKKSVLPRVYNLQDVVLSWNEVWQPAK